MKSPPYSRPRYFGTFAMLVVFSISPLVSCSTFKKEDEAFQEKRLAQEEIIHRQEAEKKRQARELEDLRRQQYHNQRLEDLDR